MRVLVFSAHCADYCSRAGGIIAKLARDGDEVKIIALSNGERSESGGLYAGATQPPLESVKAVRIEEALDAASILGAQMEFWDWGDLSFGASIDNIKAVAQAMRAYQPQIILTHHGPDPRSMDHDTCWQLVTRGMQVAGAEGLESAHPKMRRAKLFLFEATVPLTELEGFAPNVYVNITDVWETKLRALQAFRRAQAFLAEWYTDTAKRRAFQAQRLSGRKDIVFAEAFERFDPWVGNHLPLDEE